MGTSICYSKSQLKPVHSIETVDDAKSQHIDIEKKQPVESESSKTETLQSALIYPFLLIEAFIRDNKLNYLHIPISITNAISIYVDPVTKIYHVSNKPLIPSNWYIHQNNSGHISNLYAFPSQHMFTVHYSNGDLLFFAEFQTFHDLCSLNKSNVILRLSNISNIDVFNASKRSELIAFLSDDKNNMVGLLDINRYQIILNGQKANKDASQIVKYVELSPYFPEINKKYNYKETMEIVRICTQNSLLFVLCNNGKLYEKYDLRSHSAHHIKSILRIACFRDIYISDVICNDHVTFVITKHGQVYYKSSLSSKGIKFGLFENYCSEFLKYECFLVDVKITKLKLGYRHAVALDENGCVYLWGCNEFGQVMNDTNECISKPKPFNDYIKKAAAVSVAFDSIVLGGNHSFIISKTNNICYGFGNNNYQQLRLYDDAKANVNEFIPSAIMATRSNEHI